MVLGFQDTSNLEFSLYDHINSALISENIKVSDDTGAEIPVNVTVGMAVNKDWDLPIIQVFFDSKTAPRLSIGSNKRLKEFLVIIDIRALLQGQQKDIAEWVATTINDGFTFYEYTRNTSDPDNPTKVDIGLVSVDFVSDQGIDLGENADLFDKYRWRITIACTIPDLS